MNDQIAEVPMLDWIKRSVDELKLSCRSAKALRRADIRTIRQLAESTERDLLDIRNFGLTCLSEIKGRLAENGLVLGSVFEDEAKPLDASNVAAFCGAIIGMLDHARIALKHAESMLAQMTARASESESKSN